MDHDQLLPAEELEVALDPGSVDRPPSQHHVHARTDLSARRVIRLAHAELGARLAVAGGATAVHLGRTVAVVFARDRERRARDITEVQGGMTHHLADAVRHLWAVERGLTRDVIAPHAPTLHPGRAPHLAGQVVALAHTLTRETSFRSATATVRRIAVLAIGAVRVFQTSAVADVVKADLAVSAVAVEPALRDIKLNTLPAEALTDLIGLATREAIHHVHARLHRLVAVGLLKLTHTLLIVAPGRRQIQTARPDRAVQVRVTLVPRVLTIERARRTPGLDCRVRVLARGVGRMALGPTFHCALAVGITEAQIGPAVAPIHARRAHGQVLRGLE